MSSDSAKADSYLHSEATIDGLSVLILACILIIFAGVHSKNVYQDMFTASRKTLEKTSSYKAVVYTTLFAIISFAWTLIFTAIQYNFSKSSCNIAFSICEKLGFFASRGALYCTYIIRLHRTYGTSGFGWNVRNLEIIAGLIIVLTIGLFLFTELTIIFYPVEIRGDGDSFPYYCQIISDEPWFLFAGAAILLFDLVCSIASMVAFINPLHRIEEAMKENNPAAYDQHAKEMKSVGYQYKVLVIVGSTTTLLWIVLLFAQQTFLATLFINFDFIFNAVVILLMTSYYPRDKYYERLCFLCICICGERRKQEAHRSRAHLKDTSAMFHHDHLQKILYADVDKNNDDRVEKVQAIIDQKEKEVAAGGNETEQQAQTTIETKEVPSNSDEEEPQYI